jgi:release factor glutamine methyltransferase
VIAVCRVERTIGAAVAAAAALLRDAGVEEPRREAQLLLAYSLGVDRAALLARMAEDVPARVGSEFAARVARRGAREPLAYITGTRAWLEVTLTVNRSVLIPRPETEILAELAVREMRRARAADHAPLVLDAGTGSGALAIGVARRSPSARIVATDLSAGALRVARANCAALTNAGQIVLQHCDLFPRDPPLFDIIVANLPYIPTEEIGRLAPEVQFEPVEALDGGIDGLASIRALIAGAATHLHAGGSVLVECGHDQAGAVKALAARYWSSAAIEARQDYAGIERFVIVRTS